MHIKKILVGTDFSTNSMKAIKVADQWSKKYGAELVIIHASEMMNDKSLPFPMNFKLESGSTYSDFLMQELKKNLDAVTANLITPSTHIKKIVEFNSPKSAILDYIKKHGADMLVLGAHGKNWLSDLLLGSVSHQLINFSPIPVLVVKNENTAFANNLKVAIDLSPNAEKVINFISEWQKNHDSPTEICHIVEANPESYFGPSGVDSFTEYKNIQELLLEEKKFADQKLLQLTSKLDKNKSKLKVEMTHGFNPADHILKILEPKNTDLLVMASNKKGLVGSVILGSVAEKLVLKSPANCLILR
jgi:nucleotide-binding universal stress UspA family protein